LGRVVCVKESFGRRLGEAAAHAAVLPQLIDEAERQLDDVAELLARRGIVVRRPDPGDHTVPVKTPDWEAAYGRANACPRDLLLVIGDEIIEAPMAQRARFCPLLTEVEPVFDAASFVRFGRDIFWQPDLVSNQFGADWLQRHLGPAFRVRRIAFEEALPTHIGTTLVPVRPGIVLVNPERPALDGALDLFTANGWRVVPAPVSARPGRNSRDVSNWILMNNLMLDERTAVVERTETPMIALLESLGCDVVPCAFDRVDAFGGSFHCCTTDVRRAGRLQSYFPSLDAADDGAA
jgi:glycine amidinotransferase